ncbi:hypothetical protein B9479_008311, partial [Cryptococcus floricola]
MKSNNTPTPTINTWSDVADHGGPSLDVRLVEHLLEVYTVDDLLDKLGDLRRKYVNIAPVTDASTFDMELDRSNFTLVPEIAEEDEEEEGNAS